MLEHSSVTNITPTARKMENLIRDRLTELYLNMIPKLTDGNAMV